MTTDSGKKETVYVVAGSTSEFFNIARMDFKYVSVSVGRAAFETEDKIYKHISNPDHLRGLHGVEIEFWGTANKRPDFVEFLQNAEIARLK